MKLKKYQKKLEKKIDKISELTTEFSLDLCDYTADGDMIMTSDIYERDGLYYFKVTYDIPVMKKPKVKVKKKK